MSLILPDPMEITALVLAGGRARRMAGEDKGLLELAGRPLIAIVLQRLQPQVGHICISANRNAGRYQQYGWPVIRDAEPEQYLGPLAGIDSAFRQCDSDWLLTVPVDCPFLPTDLAARLCRAIGSSGRPLAVAHDGQGWQPAFCLLHRGLQASLAGFLAAGNRKTVDWQRSHDPARADFSDQPEAFVNLNTPADLRQAGQRLRNGG